jgi:hypothetical protein
MAKTSPKIWFMIIVLLSVMSFLLTSKDCKSQDWSRSGKTEIFVIGQQIDGDSTSADTVSPFYIIEVDLEVDDTFVGGLGAGYNFNDYLNLNGEIGFGSTDMELEFRGIASVKADSDLVGMDFNLDYNVLKSRFTPMVTGGIGFIYYDADFGVVDLSETVFSYNLGAGFRWDIGDHFLAKALYKLTWTELEDTDDTLKLGGVSLSIGYVF